MRADGRVTLNTSIIRSFPFGERKQIQFRGEFFNLPNHPNFGNPGHQFEGAGFGIVSAAPARTTSATRVTAHILSLTAPRNLYPSVFLIMLGEFEYILMSTLMRLGDEAYGTSIRAATVCWFSVKWRARVPR